MPRLNILLLVIDDLGWRDLACYGSTFYETPHLDRLARESLSFSRAYAASPVCSPTRASLLTGQTPARIGITQYIGGTSEGRLKDVPYLHYLPLEAPNLARTLQAAGWATWHVGKWHLGDLDFWPQHQGFDTNIGGGHHGQPPAGYFAPWRIDNLDDAPVGTELTTHLTDRAIDLIRNRNPDAPFFLNLWHYAVHTPIQAPEHLIEKYRAKAKRLGLDTLPPFVDGEHFPCLHKTDKRLRRRLFQSDPAYAAMVEHLDANIGRLLQTLDEEGLAEDTLVLFTSDNGGLSSSEGSPTCNAPLLEGKGWSYEGGTRVCQILRHPSVTRPGAWCDVPVTSCDIFPTVLEACGLPLQPDAHADGVSLMPLLRGETTLPRDGIYFHYPHYSNQGGSPSSAVIIGDWKLIEHFEDGALSLYHLGEDISEARDRSVDEPERTKAMHAMLRAWRDEVEASVPERNPDWEASIKRPRIENNAHI